mmetsp:Transcript_31005/g.53013  ORF Transcript_31005/g.53013 Transcript_31005/m.53013 type:complete len:83 (-) Transcript_31005:505-753(-)
MGVIGMKKINLVVVIVVPGTWTAHQKIAVSVKEGSALVRISGQTVKSTSVLKDPTRLCHHCVRKQSLVPVRAITMLLNFLLT